MDWADKVSKSLEPRKPHKGAREKKLETALREMLDAFSMSGALSVDGMKRRVDAKKSAREALDS